MSAVIDFHTHILPGIDDGSASVEESIAMLRMEAEQGIEHVVATPHFYPHSDDPERFLKKRARAEAALRSALTQYEGLPQVHVGAEVYFFSGISHSDALEELTIDKKGCILIEMPKVPWTERMYQELEDIWTKRGLRPVIAHIDRYITPLRTFGIPQRLAELPVLVQANASFFLHRATRGLALRMLRQERIHLLGSDCHDLFSRSPNLGPALDTIGKYIGNNPLSALAETSSDVIASFYTAGK